MFIKTTESDSLYTNLENKSTIELLTEINNEDAKVHSAIQQKLKDIEQCVDALVKAWNNGGRLFYIGSGTSGRLGIVDASECPPTFGVPADMVIGIIAGGDAAIRQAQEGAEDSIKNGVTDLKNHAISSTDIVLGLTASGTTPYVISTLQWCKKNNIKTASISCNADSPVSEFADYPIEIIVGPEYVTGSTRMKAGTAQKLVLNMITTAGMIKLGRVLGNKMVNMQLSNAKLVQRGAKMLMDRFGWEKELALQKLTELGSVRAVIDKEDLD